MSEEVEEYYVYKSEDFSIKCLGKFENYKDAKAAYKSVRLFRACGIYQRKRDGSIKNIKFYGLSIYNTKFFEQATRDAIKSRRRMTDNTISSSHQLSSISPLESNMSTEKSISPRPNSPEILNINHNQVIEGTFLLSYRKKT